MKINVEVECTAEEARRFLGLPDVKPMQDAVMAEMQRRVLDAVPASATPEALFRAWFLPMASWGTAGVQAATSALATAAGAALDPGAAKPPPGAAARPTKEG